MHPISVGVGAAQWRFAAGAGPGSIQGGGGAGARGTPADGRLIRALSQVLCLPDV